MYVSNNTFVDIVYFILYRDIREEPELTIDKENLIPYFKCS